MKPVHLEIVQGTPFRFRVRVKRKINDVLEPMDLGGSFIQLQARRTIEDEATLLDISSSTGEIVVEEEVGSFLIEMTAEATSALVWNKPHTVDTAVFQCEVTPPDGETFRALKGTLKLDPEVVR